MNRPTDNQNPDGHSSEVSQALELFNSTDAARDAATALEVMRLAGASRRARTERRFSLSISGGYVRCEDDGA
jgi:hypothetical protein